MAIASLVVPLLAGRSLLPVLSGWSAGNCEDLPGAGHALEFVDAAAFQPDRRARDQVADGAGDQDLTRAGQRGDPGSGVHGDAADLTARAVFHLAGMHPGADSQAEGPYTVAHGLSAGDRPRSYS